MPKLGIALAVLLAIYAGAGAEEPFEGDTLISPLNSANSYLLDMDGNVLQAWHGSARPASMAYLLSDGSILRPCKDLGGSFISGASGGRIQRIDGDDNIVWDFFFSDDDHQQHHDIQPMPNGNVLLIAWERKTRQEAIALGRVNINGEIWPTLIVEIEPVGSASGNVVWEWHIWDHLVQDVDPEKPDYGEISDHPELMDINFGNLGAMGGDWIHANAIDYNPELDQIVFCSRPSNEIYIIDHSTTTEEAAGHSGGNCGRGGDFLYRWGNPQNYGRGSASDQYFSVMHGVNWIDSGLPGAGNLLAFNNGDRPGLANDYSTIDEILPPLLEDGTYDLAPGAAFGPPAPVWSFGGPGGFYGGPTQCGAFRLPNGNSLACAANTGYLFEITEAGNIVWEYDHPGGIARAQRYWDPHTAVPPIPMPPEVRLLPNEPNPFNPTTLVRFELSGPARVSLTVFDVQGRLVQRLIHQETRNGGTHQVSWDGKNRAGRAVVSGIYFARIESAGLSATRKLTLLR